MKAIALCAVGAAAAVLGGCVTGEEAMSGKNAAMENMKRVMMMPEAQRMRHMTNVQQASLARGKALFESARLGTNGMACSTCHVGGGTTGGAVEMMPGMKMPIPTLRGAAATFPKYKVPNDAVITLAEMNNNCIAMMQKGKPLPLGSEAARDLAAYVTSLK